MKRTFLVLVLLTLVGVFNFSTGNAQRRGVAFGKPDPFFIRSETHVGCRTQNFSYSSGKIGPCFELGSSSELKFYLEGQSIKLNALSKGFIDIPRMASKFVADKDQTTVAVTFSALDYVLGVNDEPLFVRALIDGVEAEPGPIVFSAGFDENRFASHSFTFTATVNSGIHIVQMQWSSASSVSGSWLRNGSIFVAVDSQDDKAHRVVTKTKRLKETLTKNDSEWTAIPDTSLSFNIPENGEVAITFSGSVKMNTGDFLFIRALIDGDAALALPFSNTIADRSYHFAARSLTFTANELTAGTHKVEFEWKSSKEGTVANASLGAWSVAALTGPQRSAQSNFDVVPLPAQATTSSPEFKAVPGLEAEVTIDTISDIAVTFSAAFSGQGMLIATVSSDGVPVQEQEIILYSPGITFDDNNNPLFTTDAGAQSYTFALKDVAPRAEPYRIGIAYRVLRAVPSGEALASAYNGTMTVISKSRIGPDLAVGANMGVASSARESIIEPVHGTRKVLAIVIDPQRPEQPQADRNFMAGLDPALFGETPSAADYYKVVSGDRLNLEKAAILGPYVADKGGAVQAQNHYWDKSIHDPNGDGDCSDSIDEYGDPFKEILAEALLKAEPDFNFSEYDLDRDSVITSKELAILIVIPQSSGKGSITDPIFRPLCGGDPLIVDEVKIASVTQWYTPGAYNGRTQEEDVDSIMGGVHELAHLVLGLDDNYGRFDAIYQDGQVTFPCPDKNDPQCQTRFINTAPHPISMMTYKTITSSPHLDGFHKVQLGWATPRIIIEPGNTTLFDVRQGRQVYILPRFGTDAREYILLESRYEAADTNDPLYDYSIGDSGLAVYHVIEAGPACKAQEGATAPSCVPLLKPMCITSDLQWGTDGFASNFVRPGLRLIQPDLVHTYLGSDSNNFGETLWGEPLGVALLDTLPNGGVVCPTYVGDPLPAGGAPLLLWADGSPSGYRLKEIKTDFAAKEVTFKTEINGK